MGHGYVDVPIPHACGVPPVTRRGLDAAVETAGAAMRGLADYWAGAIADARTPLDMAVDGMRWWQVMTERRPPRWATRHKIGRRPALTRLPDFSPPSPRAAGTRCAYPRRATTPHPRPATTRPPKMRPGVASSGCARPTPTSSSRWN